MDQQQPNPAASSVDSTQQATLTSGEEGAGGGQQQKVDTIGGSSRHGGQQQQLRSTSIKSKKHTSTSQQKQKQHSSPINIEPYLDEDELKPLIYGYLHKLGRNGHWQKRFFETNGERLTYYKSVKRKKILATLDLCKVRMLLIGMVVVCGFFLFCILDPHCSMPMYDSFIMHIIGWGNFH